MTPLFKKLNFKDHSEIVVINSPDSFLPELNEMRPFTKVISGLSKVVAGSFFMVFVTKKEEIDQLIAQIDPKIEGDALIWFCYPKTTSKNYTCDFNRDTGWSALGEYNLEGVRQVAVDADWSALRFRKTTYIKKLTRSKDFALSTEGKKRTTGQ